ncbi:hypothetical protein B0H19DRAFT_1151128 [Mycena capillaripes]|nr:hypothetical protein B0H19DRAFT_1151128 [Mycena capillaripes]
MATVVFLSLTLAEYTRRTLCYLYWRSTIPVLSLSRISCWRLMSPSGIILHSVGTTEVIVYVVRDIGQRPGIHSKITCT